jgi:inner membrane protein
LNVKTFIQPKLIIHGNRQLTSQTPDSNNRVMAAVCVGGAVASDWKEDDHWAKHPLVAAATAAGCGTLPDVLEPALHPNHRQFFYSFLFAIDVGFVLYKLYQ